MKKRELEKELRHAREWQEKWQEKWQRLHLQALDTIYTVRTENLHLLVELLELAGQLKTAECEIEDLEYTLSTENAECQSFWERACHDNFVLLREKTEQNRQLENELYEIKQPRDNTWQAEAIYWKEMYHDWKKEDTAELTAKDKEIRRLEKKLKTRRGEERDGWSKCRVLCAWGVPFSLVSTGDLSDNLCGPVTIWQYHEIRRLSCVKTISLGDGYCAIVYRGLKERERIMELLR